MSYSLNEVESLAKSATRGAGYQWGMAEEAAKATRWLCAHGIDGIAELAGVLEQAFSQDPDAHCPKDLKIPRDNTGVLCPLKVGVLLSDQSQSLQGGRVPLEDVANPVFLLPFAGTAARTLLSPVTLECGSWWAVTDGTDLETASGLPDFGKNVIIYVGGKVSCPLPQQTRANPDPARWCDLRRFAKNTHAPATEESRLLGAGSGIADND